MTSDIVLVPCYITWNIFSTISQRWIEPCWIWQFICWVTIIGFLAEKQWNLEVFGKRLLEIWRYGILNYFLLNLLLFLLLLLSVASECQCVIIIVIIIIFMYLVCISLTNKLLSTCIFYLKKTYFVFIMLTRNSRLVKFGSGCRRSRYWLKNAHGSVTLYFGENEFSPLNFSFF